LWGKTEREEGERILSEGQGEIIPYLAKIGGWIGLGSLNAACQSIKARGKRALRSLRLAGGGTRGKEGMRNGVTKS